MNTYVIARSTMTAQEGSEAWVNIRVLFDGGPLDGGRQQMHFVNCLGTRPALEMDGPGGTLYRLRAYTVRRGQLLTATYACMTINRTHYPAPHCFEVP